MKKWRNLAAPDDPESWADVKNVIPTLRGTYETGYGSGAGTAITATGANTVLYAFAAKTLTGSREYVISGSKIWELDAGAGTVTDRTNAVAVGTIGRIMMAQYGNVTIAVMGANTATASSTGGNFTALSGAPKGEIVVVQSNAAVIFNTDTSADGWEASDVGDYTNWSSGENAVGRIIATPGPITGAVPFGNDILVFKPDAIYRMTYVGGAVKWQTQLIWRGQGVSPLVAATANMWKYQIVATRRGVAFIDGSGLHTGYARVYLFDGASEPVLLNPATEFASNSGQYHTLHYDPSNDVLTLAPSYGSSATGTYTAGGSDSYYYYYNFRADLWSRCVGGSGEVTAAGNGSGIGPLMGEWNASYALQGTTVSKPPYWAYRGVADTLTRCAPGTRPSTCYLQTTKIGRSDRKTIFDRLIPLLRRRSDLGTDSAALSFELFREREDSSAQSTRAVTESTARKRFDLLGGAAADNYARFKVTWTDLDVEVDDFIVESHDGGRE